MPASATMLDSGGRSASALQIATSATAGAGRPPILRPPSPPRIPGRSWIAKRYPYDNEDRSRSAVASAWLLLRLKRRRTGVGCFAVRTAPLARGDGPAFWATGTAGG